MKTFYIQTYGCQMNQYDSQRTADLLSKHFDACQVTAPEEADLLLVNTCSVREKPQEKTFSELGRWRRYKEQRPDVLIGVGGCVASQEGRNILARAGFVDLVFGPQTIHRLPQMIEQVRAKQQAVVDISFPEIEKFDQLPRPNANGVSAYVSIMEGCNKFCTYCIVPYTRGREISRPFVDVLKEVIHLTRQGVKEITFLGQNVNAYSGRTQQQEFADLATLIQYTAEIPGVERIRFTTSHPVEFGPRLIQLYAEESKLAAQLHLPVQSGSDRILAAMKRGHTAAQYVEKIRALRQSRPGIKFSTDIIVGFPGETEEDFLQTLELVEELNPTQAFSFLYSTRPGTPASEHVDDVPLAIKKDRLYRLQAVLNQQATAHNQMLVGTQQAVLVNGPSKRNPLLLTGRTECNKLVHFRGQKENVGMICLIDIEEVRPNCLLGKLAVTRDDFVA